MIDERSNIQRSLVEIAWTNAVDQRHHDLMMDKQQVRRYLIRSIGDSIEKKGFGGLHRYFSSIFPRQSKANAIFIASNRIEPVRLLKQR